MARRVWPYLIGVGLLSLMSGCSLYQKPQRPAWRAAAENACFAEKRIQLSAYVQPAPELEGPGICGLTRPLHVTALQGGQVRLNSRMTLDCPMVAELESWLTDVIQPAAIARFGQPVVQINTMGAYACRGMNNQIGARISEHAFGNAIDVGGFVLADGRAIVIRRDWTHGDEQTQAFLRDAQGGACERFTTVLAPGSNAFHYDHIHVDLAMHGSTSRGLRRICKPALQNVAPPPSRDNLPEAPDLEEETDSAQLKTYPGRDYARAAPSGAVPPTPPLALGPRNLSPPREVAGSGIIRADGAFDPDDDSTSTIRMR
ncbi:MAG: extensin family protein [Hyphomicrobiales bacterium]|nr:extensin family protein [Hyphomicrobiales bacterium]